MSAIPDFAPRLRALIERQGFSISGAAEMAGMEKQQAHRIVTGKARNPGIETVRRLVEAVGCTMADLYAED